MKVKHFFFPLNTWLIEILLSVFCFIVETIFHYLRKSKPNAPSAVLEERNVTQSTLESEDGHYSDVEDIEDTFTK